MAGFSDLQSYLKALEMKGDLKRVKIEVDPELEITEIAQRVVNEDGPAILFENVKGAKYPLAINIMGSMRRIETALGRHPAELGTELIETIEKLNPPSVKNLWKSRSRLMKLMAARKKRVGSGISQEEIDQPADLTKLPIIKCWPDDGGRFITFPLVLTYDPLNGRSNLGTYRMQMFDQASTGMHWQIQKGGGFHYFQAEKMGKPLEVAVAIGGDPALMLSAIMPLPEGIEELVFSGILRGKPTKLTRGKTLAMDVPANAEFVLEGVVQPHERKLEGPFGDHFGHYSEAAQFPVFHINAITHRRNPIYAAAVVGKPPQEDKAMGDAVQEITGPAIRLIQPEVKDLWAYYQAGFHNFLVVSVESRYTKEPMKSALALLGNGQLSLTKCVVLVDSSVNVRDFKAVLQEIRQHFDPKEDFLMLPKVPLDTLDFTSFKMHLGSKMVMDATRAGKPQRSIRPGLHSDLRQLAPEIKKWRVLEDTLLAIQATGDAKQIISRLVKSDALSGISMLAAVSPDVQIEDDTNLMWGIFTRFDPARDIVFSDMHMTDAAPVYSGVMGIDATHKKGYPAPLEMTSEIKAKVDKRWDQYWK